MMEHLASNETLMLLSAKNVVKIHFTPENSLHKNLVVIFRRRVTVASERSPSDDPKLRLEFSFVGGSFVESHTQILFDFSLRFFWVGICLRTPEAAHTYRPAASVAERFSDIYGVVPGLRELGMGLVSFSDESLDFYGFIFTSNSYIQVQADDFRKLNLKVFGWGGITL